MNATTLRLLARRVLLAVAVFNALSAVAGGVMLVIGGLTGGSGGMSIPLSVLDGTPFGSFLWPGVILAVVVGGTQVLAVALQLRGNAWSQAAMAVAGFALVIWMFVEVALIEGFSALQGIYFGTGLAQLALLAGALGVLPAGIRMPHRAHARGIRHAL